MFGFRCCHSLLTGCLAVLRGPTIPYEDSPCTIAPHNSIEATRYGVNSALEQLDATDLLLRSSQNIASFVRTPHYSSAKSPCLGIVSLQ